MHLFTLYGLSCKCKKGPSFAGVGFLFLWSLCIFSRCAPGTKSENIRSELNKTAIGCILLSCIWISIWSTAVKLRWCCFKEVLGFFHPWYVSNTSLSEFMEAQEHSYYSILKIYFPCTFLQYCPLQVLHCAQNWSTFYGSRITGTKINICLK